MTIDKFNSLKEKYSKISSWAVWAEADKGPASNIDNINIFNIEENPGIINIINPNIILVGSNPAPAAPGQSIDFNREWGNFHTKYPKRDFVLRYAFYKTKIWGAYMTDFAKFEFQPNIGILKGDIRDNPEIMNESIRLFHEELKDLEAINPIILAFGPVVFDYITMANIKIKHKLIKIPHFCDPKYNNKDDYRNEVLRRIRNI